MRRTIIERDGELWTVQCEAKIAGVWHTSSKTTNDSGVAMRFALKWLAEA